MFLSTLAFMLMLLALVVCVVSLACMFSKRAARVFGFRSIKRARIVMLSSLGLAMVLFILAVSIVDPERLEEHGARLENIIEEQEALLEQLKDRGEESGEQVDESYE